MLHYPAFSCTRTFPAQALCFVIFVLFVVRKMPFAPFVVEEKRRAEGVTTKTAKGQLSGFWSITAGTHLPGEPLFFARRKP